MPSITVRYGIFISVLAIATFLFNGVSGWQDIAILVGGGIVAAGGLMGQRKRNRTNGYSLVIAGCVVLAFASGWRLWVLATQFKRDGVFDPQIITQALVLITALVVGGVVVQAVVKHQRAPKRRKKRKR